MERKIYASFDDEGVFVYQAFKPSIVKTAVELRTFGSCRGGTLVYIDKQLQKEMEE